MSMDNEQFFRHCWLTLKRSRPNLRKYMDDIEILVEGAGKVANHKPSPKNKSEDNKNDTTEDKGVIV